MFFMTFRCSRFLFNLKSLLLMPWFSRLIALQDEAIPNTLAGLLTTPGYSNDITKNGNSGDGKASSRESRGECHSVDRRPVSDVQVFLGRSVGGGPMRSRSRNIDTSPYSSNNTAYLSPPESSWRRTSSDSAIHQSLAQAQVRLDLRAGDLESKLW